jgi:hypothetical protein
MADRESARPAPVRIAGPQGPSLGASRKPSASTLRHTATQLALTEKPWSQSTKSEWRRTRLRGLRHCTRCTGFDSSREYVPYELISVETY